MRAFCDLSEVATVLAKGQTKATVRLRIGLQVDLRVLPPDSFGAALHYFTGSKAHNIAVRTRAVHRGIKLSEYGVFDREGRRLSGGREEEVFAAVGLPWIPPELREGSGEIEAAESGRLPHLVNERDVIGDLHVHSEASADARASLEELADEADRLGRRYLAITDHSRSRPLGLDERALAAQRDRIATLNRERSGVRLLAGVEVDILPDGSLDLPPQALAGLDWVVASVHSDFGQSRAQMTDRIVRALRSGVVDVLGHPTGRRIGHRDPYDADLDAVLEVAREEGVALEVNAMPERLDLNDRACRLAKEAGVRVAISTDAHVATHLPNLRNGVWVARRGWLAPEDVINARPLEELWRSRRRH
jgi:DNA polymerase (family 10)